MTCGHVKNLSNWLANLDCVMFLCDDCLEEYKKKYDSPKKIKDFGKRCFRESAKTKENRIVYAVSNRIHNYEL